MSERAESRPWFSDNCGALNSGPCCAQCARDAPTRALFPEPQGEMRDGIPLGGLAGVGKWPKFMALAVLIGLVGPVVLSLLWTVAQRLTLY
ncbi:MAG: hypothetical protein JNK63_11685 [Chthonomonas sp.]|nr:hypothetical protein [Chthonomonas sp.]